MSELAKIPYNTLYSIVRRNSDNIDLSTVAKIADALEVSPFDFLGDDVKKWIDFGMEIYKKAAEDDELFADLDNRFRLDQAIRTAYNIKSEYIVVEATPNDLNSNDLLIHLLLKAFSALNEVGQKVACERVEELAKIDDYKRTEPPETFSGDSEGSCTSQREKPSERPSSTSGSK